MVSMDLVHSCSCCTGGIDTETYIFFSLRKFFCVYMLVLCPSDSFSSPFEFHLQLAEMVEMPRR